MDSYNIRCDVCYEIKGCDVTASACCTTCTNFLCEDCKGIHESCHGMESHELLLGEGMTKLKDDDFSSDRCNIHKECQNDIYCFDHASLICSKCKEESHTKCKAQMVSEVSECIDTDGIENLKETVNKLKADIGMYRARTVVNITKIETQRTSMLNEALAIHGSLIANINYLHFEIKGEIFKTTKEKLFRLSCQKARIDSVLKQIDHCIEVIEEMKIENKNEDMFVSIENIVSQAKQFVSFLNELQKSSKKIDLLLKPSQDTLELLDSTFCFGRVESTQNSYELLVDVIPDISFPFVTTPSTKRKLSKGRKQKHVSRRKLEGEEIFNSTPVKVAEVMKENMTMTIPTDNSRISLRQSVNIQTDFDTKPCLINGIAVTCNRQKIFADYNNQNLKLFGPNMQLLSSFSLESAPHGIACTTNNQIVACYKDTQLLFLDISEGRLIIKQKRKMKRPIYGIACDENAYLFMGTNSPSIKKVDRDGKRLWIVNKDKQGHKLFKSAAGITCSIWNEDTRVIATDDVAETITMIDGETGNLLVVRSLTGKQPRNMTTDFYGNIYVCFAKTHEICIMTRNLTEDKILLSAQEGLSPEPLAIAYDCRADQIVTSNNLYFRRDTVDIFQKSFYF